MQKQTGTGGQRHRAAAKAAALGFALLMLVCWTAPPRARAEGQDVAAGDTVSGGTASGDTVSGGTVSGDTVSGDTIPGGTASGDTVPGDTVTDTGNGPATEGGGAGAAPAESPAPAVPVAAGETVTFRLPELILAAGYGGDLLADAAAEDENGTALALYVTDAAGFDANAPGDYAVAIGALHPVSGNAYAGVRSVRVLTAAAYTDWANAENAALHAEYLGHRQWICDGLRAQKARLTAEAQARIDAFAKANRLPENYVLMLAGSDADGLEIVDKFESRNWLDVVTVFVAARCFKLEMAADLYALRDEYSLERIETVFFDMLEITLRPGEEDDECAAVLVRCLRAEDVLDGGTLGDKAQRRLRRMCEGTYRFALCSLIGEDALIDLSRRERAAISGALPAGLSDARRAVVLAARRLRGRTPYFSGGKYAKLGWNPEWGVPAPNCELESAEFGALQPYGLDCAGFVAWCFVNGLGDEAVAREIGAGSAKQWAHSRAIAWDEALPGDLAFYGSPDTAGVNHVGIVVAVDAGGPVLIAHCAAEAGTVAIDRAENCGFTLIRRPDIFED